jgi:predicted nucleic acid-binding protein
MPDYLLDTNHATQLLGGNESLRQRVQAAAVSGDTFSISMTVLGELYYAAYASRRRDENLQAVRAFAADVLLHAFDESAADEFGRIQSEQVTAQPSRYAPRKVIPARFKRESSGPVCMIRQWSAWMPENNIRA